VLFEKAEKENDLRWLENQDELNDFVILILDYLDGNSKEQKIKKKEENFGR